MGLQSSEWIKIRKIVVWSAVSGSGGDGMSADGCVENRGRVQRCKEAFVWACGRLHRYLWVLMDDILTSV